MKQIYTFLPYNTEICHLDEFHILLELRNVLGDTVEF